MKHISFAVLITLFFSVTATAQKNTWMIFGNGTYDNMAYSNNNGGANYYGAAPLSLTGWGANAGAGCMVSEHIMVGLQGGYNSQEEADQSDYYFNSYPYAYYGKEKVSNWQAGAFCRYTTALGKRFFVYAQFFGGKYGVNYKDEPTTQGYTVPPYYTPVTPNLPDGNGFIFNLLPAVGMNIFHGYGINLSIGGISYSTYTSTTDPSTLHHLNVTLGREYTFGIHKVINWNKLTAPPTAPAAPAN